MYKATLIALLLSITAISCTTTKQSSTTRVMDVYGPGVIQLPVVGELDVDINKVSESVSESGTTINAEQLKVTAVNRAVKNADADILVEPTFDISAERNVTTVVVTGYPAIYTEFRSATQDDIPLLNAGRLQKASTMETQEVSRDETQSSNSFLILAALGGIAGLAYFMSDN